MGRWPASQVEVSDPRRRDTRLPNVPGLSCKSRAERGFCQLQTFVGQPVGYCEPRCSGVLEPAAAGLALGPWRWHRQVVRKAVEAEKVWVFLE